MGEAFNARGPPGNNLTRNLTVAPRN